MPARRCAWLAALTLSVGAFAALGAGEEAPKAEPWTVEPTANHQPWSKVVGKRVQAEGLALGWGNKGLGKYVLVDAGLSDGAPLAGARIFIEGPNSFGKELNGKTVRVTGTLERRHMEPPVRAFEQGYTTGFDYYNIRAECCEPVERVTDPYLHLVTEGDADRRKAK